MTDYRQKARKFREYWLLAKDSETGGYSKFWLSLLSDVLGVDDVFSRIDFQSPVPMKGTTKYLDAWIPETRVLIEHKSRGIKLDAPQSGHGGKTPFEQAVEYNQARGFSEKARWIVTCNFDEIWVYDMDKPLDEPQKILLANLPKEISRLGFLVDSTVKSVREQEKDISIKAGRIVGELYRELLKRYADNLPLRHVWQEDKGFRKTEILNKAVQAAQSEYLIFMDQDLVPRCDFISQHYRHAAKGRFVSGGAILMPKALSEALTQEDICSGRAFDIHWLQAHGMPWNWKMSKLWRNAWVCCAMNWLTPAKASWNGGNASTWREYILQANGFDTRMRYGAEDREFGQRLENAGIKGIQLRYGTPLLHLYHERPYRNEEDLARNKAIWRETRKQKLTKTAYGIQ